MRQQQLNPTAPQWNPPPYSAFPRPYYYLPTHHQVGYYLPTHPPLLLYNQHTPFLHFHRPPAHHFPANNEVVPEMNAVEELVEKPAEEKPKSPKTPVPARTNFNGGRVTRSFPRNETRPNMIWRPIKRDTTPANSDELLPENTENTTVMIKNIPNCVRRSFMLKILDEACKKESIEYDFMYLPMDFKSCHCFGYAFVNFTTVDSANKFKKSFHGFKWKNVQTERGLMTSPKICNITWAEDQGKDRLERRFREMVFNCHTPEFLPVLLDPPRNGMDPNPPPPVVIGKLRNPMS